MLRLLAGIPKLEAPLHDLAGLSCADHGGPSNDHAAEMVYWSDIPSDADFKSPIGANDKSISILLLNLTVEDSTILGIRW